MSDDRTTWGIYCGSANGDPCKYEVDPVPLRYGIACSYYKTYAGIPRVLKIGHDASGIRCTQCRNDESVFKKP